MGMDHRHADDRRDDRDEMLYRRLDQLERAYQNLTATVTQLDTSVNVVKLEQSHLKELFDARLQVIEKNQEMLASKFDHVSSSISLMTGDPEKTPAGRTTMNIIRSVQASLDEQSETLARHKSVHDNLKDWQTRVDGVLIVLKWIGASGIVAMGLALLRLLTKGL